MQGAPVQAGGAGWGSPQGWGPAAGPSLGSPKQNDLDALSSFKRAFVVALLGTALSFTYPIVTYASGSRIFGIPATGSSLGIARGAVEAYFGVVLAGLVIALVSFFLMHSGFVRLRPIDSRFASTPTFNVVAMIGIALLAVGLGVFLAWLLQLISCVGSASTVPSSCVGLAGVLGGLALVGIGAIVLLVGGIGTVVGLWHLGNRYNDALFKVGAVLLIFFGIVGAILLLLGTLKAERTVRTRPEFAPPPPVMAPPFPPAPPAL